jgi:hypothetical protein
MRGNLVGWPDLHGFTRFVRGDREEHDEHDTQIEGKKHTHTHTKGTPVVLVGLIH